MATSIRTLAEAAKEIGWWLEWELDSLELFHAYGHRFGDAGENVYMLVLKDALKHRGLTLEQLKTGTGRK